MTGPPTHVPPWLEEERKSAADEVAQLKTKILLARTAEKDVRRALTNKHLRCQEELDEARAQLADRAGPGTPAVSKTANGAGDISAMSSAAEDMAAAIQAAVNRERALGADQIRTLHSDSESRTKEGLVKMAAVQRELDAQRMRVSQMAAEKSKLVVLVEQLRKGGDANDGTGGGSLGSSSSDIGIASRMASTAHDAQSQAAELSIENKELKQQLEKVQYALLRDRSQAEEVARTAAASAAARDELAMARQSHAQNPPPKPTEVAEAMRAADEADKQLFVTRAAAAAELHMTRAAAAAEQAALRQEIARLTQTSETAGSGAADERREELNMRRSLEARVREAEAEIVRERERRADVERKFALAETRATAAAESSGGGPARASVALMSAHNPTKQQEGATSIQAELSRVRRQLTTQVAGQASERGAAATQIKALAMKNAKLAATLSEEQNKKSIFAGFF